MGESVPPSVPNWVSLVGRCEVAIQTSSTLNLASAHHCLPLVMPWDKLSPCRKKC